MADEKFSDNLLRMVAAELHFLNCVTAGREMFGKGYFSLSPTEKNAVDQAVLAGIAGNYGALTPEMLANVASRQPVGFHFGKTET
jgi:hypothetical protein